MVELVVCTYKAVRSWRQTIIVVLGLAALRVCPAAAETRAVVVGIDDYRNFRQLHGAVSDAMDISEALRRHGVKDIVTLLNGAATRSSVLNAIDQMISKVHKDDLAIITFAGHGGRESWGRIHPPGTSPGDPHEVFLLRDVKLPDADGNVDPKRGGSAGERIFGVEMAMRLKRLDDIGARTIFVADTCHGGGMTRQPPDNAPSVPDTTRFVQYPTYAEGADPLLPTLAKLPPPIDTDRDLRSLSFLAAVDRVHSAPEIEIPKGSGNQRGALSYAFARVIEGAALRGGRTELTHGDLLSYVMASVKNNVLDNGKGQDPDLRPRENFMRVTIKFGVDLTLDSNPAMAVPVAEGIKIYSQDARPVDAVRRPERGFSIQPVATLAEADLIYKPGNGDVFSKGGDLVATQIPPADLEGVAEREVAIRRLVELARTRARPIALERGDRRYVSGEKPALDARRPAGQAAASEYYILFVISGNGLVQFQYPVENDPRILPNDRALTDMEASEPFGADYFVLVTDEKPLDELIKSIRALGRRKEPNAAVSLIEKSLTNTMQIGLQGVYTSPKPVP